jgi:hypothetical protein
MYSLYFCIWNVRRILLFRTFISPRLCVSFNNETRTNSTQLRKKRRKGNFLQLFRVCSSTHSLASAHAWCLIGKQSEVESPRQAKITTLFFFVFINVIVDNDTNGTWREWRRKVKRDKWFSFLIWITKEDDWTDVEGGRLKFFLASLVELVFIV